MLHDRRCLLLTPVANGHSNLRTLSHRGARLDVRAPSRVWKHRKRFAHLSKESMKIALIAPPFIPVPPVEYGGTELFIANLAGKLKERGVEVILYTNGASTADVE